LGKYLSILSLKKYVYNVDNLRPIA